MVVTERKRNTYPKHQWTDEERGIVRRDYRGTNASAQNIANRLSEMTGERITFYAVKGQAIKLGVTINRSKPWTPQEEELLAQLIPRYAVETIARKLKRSVTSIVQKSKKIGISLRARDGWYTKSEVCEILGVDHHKVQTWIGRGDLRASYNNGRKPGQKGTAMWHIDESDLRDFIINNSFELMGRNVDLFQIIVILTGGPNG